MDNGPRTKCDQVIFEAVCKACEIIVASRSRCHHPPSQQRFNLQVPEIPTVRQILSRYKNCLPLIRVDVYYQHEVVNSNSNSNSNSNNSDDNGDRDAPNANNQSNRELLERWCLAYVPQTMAAFLAREPQVPNNDSIVQLRHVCKRMVVFLRTLYCQARLVGGGGRLQGDPHVGFSVYAPPPGAGNHKDIQDLVHQQNFQVFHNVSSVVTPYGDLSWKVAYAAPEALSRLLPAKSARMSPSRPIPIQKQQQHQQQQQHQPQQQQRAKSMPRRGYLTPSTNSNGTSTATAAAAAATYQQTTGGLIPPKDSSSSLARTYDSKHAHRNYHRSHTSEEVEFGNNNQHQQPNLLQQHQPIREYMAPLKNGSSGKSNTNANNNNSNNSKPPRVLSGLSLALLSAQDDDDDANNDDAKQQRRAALHQLPPQILPDSAAPAPSAQYGYGYNNHIPLHPTGSAGVGRTTNNNRRRDSLESQQQQSPIYNNGIQPSLSSTPPAAFLATTPPGLYNLPAANGSATNHNTPNTTTTMGHLIPPKQLPVTPPFIRPLGFCQESAVTSSPKMPNLGGAVTANNNTTANSTPHADASTAPAEPPASLDLLRSNPFGQQSLLTASQMLPPEANSMLASTMASPSLLSDASHMHSHHNHSGASNGGGRYSPQEEMPFAVDDVPAAAASTSLLASNNSATVASFAQQCQSIHRLQLFENTASGGGMHEQQQQQQQHTVDVDEQLSEFANFGASLMLGGSSDDHSSAATPQPA